MSDIFQANDPGHITEHNRLLGDRGLIPLDLFPGADDNAKLLAAYNHIKANDTYPRLVSFSNRQHTLTSNLQTIFGEQPFPGFGMIACGRGWNNPEKGTGYNKTPLVLNIGATSFWDVASGDAWNWYMEGFQISGSSTATLITGSGGGTLWASTFRNMQVQGLKGVFGNSSSKLLVDLITVDGQWEILNCFDTYVNVGGGDVRGFFSDGGNFGCGSTPDGAGKYQMIFGGFSKGNLGGSSGIYITADNGWRGLKITGSQSSGYAFDVFTPIIEGRNNSSPCNGNLMLITGGSVNIVGGCIDMGMASPSAGEHGLIEVNGTGTEVSIYGTTFTHCSAVASTMPCVYASGTAGQVSVGVYGLKRGFRTGGTAWGSQRPRVQQAVTGLVLASDTFCDLVTAA